MIFRNIGKFLKALKFHNFLKIDEQTFPDCCLSALQEIRKPTFTPSAKLEKLVKFFKISPIFEIIRPS
jgi:hypothetical protein